jgi:hypothetical protein
MPTITQACVQTFNFRAVFVRPEKHNVTLHLEISRSVRVDTVASGFTNYKAEFHTTCADAAYEFGSREIRYYHGPVAEDMWNACDHGNAVHAVRALFCDLQQDAADGYLPTLITRIVAELWSLAESGTFEVI